MKLGGITSKISKVISARKGSQRKIVHKTQGEKIKPKIKGE